MLKALDLKKVYNPRVDGVNVVDAFLVPALQKSATYKRVSGYFSSVVFAQVAQGIGALYESGGKMQLVTSHSLTPRDAGKLSEFIDDEAFAQTLIQEFEDSLEVLRSTASAIAEDHLKAMCWLLKQGFLEIKIVVPNPGPSQQVKLGDYEKFHPKFGIFTDADGNEIAFSGSLNETYSGWFKNVENICVYNSWEPALIDYVDAYREQFESYWSNQAGEEWIVLDLPDAVKQKIIETSGVDEFPESVSRASKAKLRGLREYQNEAVEAWMKNGNKGILEMATGTGKTRTALACVREAAKLADSLVVVVVAPYQHIAEQWEQELREYRPIVAGSGTGWRSKLNDIKLNLQLNTQNQAVIIAVKNTAASIDFISQISELSAVADKTMFVGDEVHWLGATTFQSSLLPFAEYRLGLSATPNRYFDDEGTDVLRDYFGGVIYKFGLREALNWLDEESGQTVLCPYEYKPVFVELDEEERKDYQEKSASIARKLSGEVTPKTLEEVNLLRLLRANIGKSAKSKIPAFKKAMEAADKPITFTLVYCSDLKQMEQVAQILKNIGLDYQKVTGDESTKQTKKLGGHSERELILKNFAEGRIDILLAIDCLDEGVDIPAAKQAYILASSGNPKEFIQRRGRIMRQFPGKTQAEIVDFVVVPPLAKTPGSEDEREEMLRVHQTEFDRVFDFADDALNGSDVKKMIESMGYKREVLDNE